jgi:cytidine deaminase
MSGLVEAAQAARANAYCPYSGYAVGAAVMDENGRIWAGCNVENVSYGLALCAERSAVAQMVAGGGRRVHAVAVATADGGTPCGMCRQTLAEFAPVGQDVPVWTVDAAGGSRQHWLHALLPDGFASKLPGPGPK